MQQLFPAEIALARFQLALLNNYVDLYKALGGGWTIETQDWEPPNAPAASNPSNPASASP
jgi:hypothetical protein